MEQKSQTFKLPTVLEEDRVSQGTLFDQFAKSQVSFSDQIMGMAPVFANQESPKVIKNSHRSQRKIDRNVSVDSKREQRKIYEKHFTAFEKTMWNAISQHQLMQRQEMERQRFETNQQRAQQLRNARSQPTVQKHSVSVTEFKPKVSDGTSQHLAVLKPSRLIKRAQNTKPPRAKTRSPSGASKQFQSQPFEPQQERATPFSPQHSIVTVQQSLQSDKPPNPLPKLRPPKPNPVCLDQLQPKSPSQTEVQPTREKEREAKHNSQSPKQIHPYSNKVPGSPKLAGSPKCTFILKPDEKSFVHLQTEVLNSRLDTAYASDRKRALMKFLQKKMASTKISLETDQRLIQGLALTDAKVRTEQASEFDPEEQSLYNLTLLRTFVRPESEVFVQQTNVNIIQNVIESHPPKELIENLNELAVQKSRLSRNVSRAVQKLLANEISLQDVIKGPTSQKRSQVWEATRKFCEASLKRIEPASETALPRVTVEKYVIEEPEETQVELTREQAEEIGVQRNKQDEMHAEIERCFEKEGTLGEVKYFRKYLHISRFQKRANSTVVDLEYDAVFNAALKEKTSFPDNYEVKRKALDLLQSECLKTIKAWSSTHSDILTKIYEELESLETQRHKDWEKASQQMMHEMVACLQAITTEMARLQLENKRKDKVIRELLTINDKIQTHNELAMRLYHKADDERTCLKVDLDELKGSVLTWMPNFVRYHSENHLLRKIGVILPDLKTTLNHLGGVNWWHTCLFSHNDEASMWGLEVEDLADITYKGDFIKDETKYHESSLWLRSDLCRLQKLMDVPTETAVELERCQKKVAKLTKKQSVLEDEIKLLSDKSALLQTEVQSLREENQKQLATIAATKKSLDEVTEALDRANSFINREKVDKDVQTDKLKKVSHQQTMQQNLTMSKSKSQMVGFAATANKVASEITDPGEIKGISNATRKRLRLRRMVTSVKSRNNSVLQSTESEYLEEPSRLRVQERRTPRRSVTTVLTGILKGNSPPKSAVKFSQSSRVTVDQQTSRRLFRFKLGVITPQKLFQARLPDMVWEQKYKKRYTELAAAMIKLTSHCDDNTLGSLWHEQLPDESLDQAKDIFELTKHDWRFSLLAMTSSLQFEEDDVFNSSLTVTYSVYDTFAANLCSKVFQQFSVDIESMFAFQPQESLISQDLLNQGVPTASKLVYLHEAFHCIASEVVRMCSPEKFERLGASLLCHVFFKLHERCESMVVGRSIDQKFPDCTVSERQVIKLGTDQSREYSLLEQIARKVTLFNSNQFLASLPLTPDEFLEVLQKDFGVDLGNHVDLNWQAFIAAHISESGLIDREAIRGLETVVVAYQLRIEHVVMMAASVKRMMDEATEHHLSSLYASMAKDGKVKFTKLRKTAIKIAERGSEGPKRIVNQKILEALSICNEVETTLKLSQIETVSLPQFARMFEAMAVSFGTLDLLGSNLKMNLPESFSQSLSELSEFLQATFSSQPNNSTDRSDYLNLQTFQANQKMDTICEKFSTAEINNYLYGDLLPYTVNSIENQEKFNLDLQEVKLDTDQTPVKIGAETDQNGQTLSNLEPYIAKTDDLTQTEDLLNLAAILGQNKINESEESRVFADSVSTLVLGGTQQFLNISDDAEDFGQSKQIGLTEKEVDKPLIVKVKCDHRNQRRLMGQLVSTFQITEITQPELDTNKHLPKKRTPSVSKLLKEMSIVENEKRSKFLTRHLRPKLPSRIKSHKVNADIQLNLQGEKMQPQ